MLLNCTEYILKVSYVKKLLLFTVIGILCFTELVIALTNLIMDKLLKFCDLNGCYKCLIIKLVVHPKKAY